MSLVFNEARPLSSFVQAEDVLRTNGTSDPVGFIEFRSDDVESFEEISSSHS